MLPVKHHPGHRTPYAVSAKVSIKYRMDRNAVGDTWEAPQRCSLGYFPKPGLPVIQLWVKGEGEEGVPVPGLGLGPAAL